MSERLKFAIVLGSLAAVPPICTEMYVAAFPIIGETFNVSATDVQLSLTSSLLGIATGQIFIGPLSDIHGRKKPLLLSLLIFIIASFCCAIAASMTQFILLRFIQGLAGSGGVVLSRSIAYDKYKGPSLTSFIALLMIINGIAPILSPVLGGQIINLFSWRAVFRFLTLCGIALLAASLKILPETLEEKNRMKANWKRVIASFLILFRNKSYLACMVIHCLILGGMFAYVSASTFILQVVYDFSPVEFSLCFALNGLGSIIVTKFSANMIMLYNEQTQLKVITRVFTFIGIALLGISLFNIHILPLLLILLFMISSCIGAGQCNAFSLAMHHIKGNAGSASGLLGITSFLMGAILSPLVSLAGETSIFPLALIIFLCGAISMFSLSTLSASHH